MNLDSNIGAVVTGGASDFDNNQTRRWHRTCVLGARIGRYEDVGREAMVRATA